MSEAGGPDGGGDGLGREAVDLARALRAELQTLNDGELRRQARLVAFDQQMAQMESSIRGEVERLRTTGSVVELLADLLRQSLGAVENDRRFEPIHEQLAQLRDDTAGLVEALVLPDLAPVHDQLDRLREQVGALPQPEPQPDLTPLREQLDQLHVRLAAIPTRDLRPIHDRLEALGAAVAALPAVDLMPLHADVRRLQAQLSALPRVDLDPVHVQLQAIESQIRDLPPPDDAAVQSSVAAVAEQVSDLRRTVDGLPAIDAVQSVAADVTRLSGLVEALPVHDDAPVREEVRRLAAEIDGLRTAMADRFDALPPPAHVADLLRPALDRLTELAHPASVLAAVEQGSQGVSEQLSALRAASEELGDRIDRLPDHADHLDALAGTREALEREVAQLADVVRGVAENTAPIAALESGLGGIRSAILSLEAVTGASVAGASETADAQALALARVTAATDGFASTVGTLRTAMSTAASAASEETVAALDERLEGRLRVIEARVSAAIEDGLRSVDLHPLHERLRALDERIAALPLPDLGPVATQLARLSATITSETTVRPAGASQLDAVAASVSESTTALLAQLDAQAAEVRSMATLLRSLPSAAETQAIVEERVTRALEAIHAQLAALAERVDPAKRKTPTKAPSKAASKATKSAAKKKAPAKREAPRSPEG